MDAAATAPPMEHKLCSAHTKAGKPCQKSPIKGGTVCATHGGSAPHVRAAAARRLAQAEAVATLAEVDVVPIGNPLEELAEVAAECRAFQKHVADRIAEERHLTGVDKDGARVLSIFVPLYERSLDRVGKLLADWVRLGFDERLVTLHERQVDLVAQLLRAVLDDPTLGLTNEQRAAAPAVVRGHLHLLKGAA